MYTEKDLNKVYKVRISEFIKQRMTTDLCFKSKCDTTTKSLDGVITYIKAEARKQAEDNVAVIPDETVFEWVVHYILEDSLNCEPNKQKTESATVKKTESAVKEKTPEPVAEPEEAEETTLSDEVSQLSFDF